MYQLRKKQNLNKNLCSDCTLKKRSPEMAFSLRNAGNIQYSDTTVKSCPLSKDTSLCPATCADLVHTLHCKTERAWELEAHSEFVQCLTALMLFLDLTYFIYCVYICSWKTMVHHHIWIKKIFSIAFLEVSFRACWNGPPFVHACPRAQLLKPLNSLMESCQMLQNSHFCHLDSVEFLRGKPAGIFET